MDQEAYSDLTSTAKELASEVRDAIDQEDFSLARDILDKSRALGEYMESTNNPSGAQDRAKHLKEQLSTAADKSGEEAIMNSSTASDLSSKYQQLREDLEDL